MVLGVTHVSFLKRWVSCHLLLTYDVVHCVILCETPCLEQHDVFWAWRESVLSYAWAFVVFVSLVFEQQGGLTLIKWSFLDVYLNATPLHHELAHLWNFDSLVHSISINYFVYNMIFLQVSPTDDSILSARLVDNVTVAGCSLCTHSLPQSSLHNEGRKLEIFRFSWSGYIAKDWMCLLIATNNDCTVNCYWLCICDFRDVNLLFTFYNFKYAFKMFNKNNHYNIDPVLFTASC